MKYLAINLLSFLFICGFSMAQSDKKAQAGASPEFNFEVEEYNFGTVKEGAVVEYEFRFTNKGNEPLIISNVQSTCGCTVPEWPQEPIEKGKTGSIKVVFNSAGKVGLQNRPITIFSNAKSSPKIVHLKGNVEADKSKEK